MNSAQRGAERKQAWKAIRQASAEYLFLSPEQLANDEVVDALAELGVALFVVDEAHCVSAWGHDFRPDYLRLAPVIERLGHPRVIALTATAALPVRRDIVERLGLRDHREVIDQLRPARTCASPSSGSPTTATSATTLITRVRALTADPATRSGPGLRGQPQGHGVLRRRARADRCAGRGLSRRDARGRPRAGARAVPRRRPRCGRRRRRRSGWASTSRTCGSSCTRRPRSRWTPTTSRSGGPDATASPPRSACSTVPRTSACRSSSPPARPPRTRSARWPHTLEERDDPVRPAELKRRDRCVGRPARRGR